MSKKNSGFEELDSWIKTNKSSKSKNISPDRVVKSPSVNEKSAVNKNMSENHDHTSLKMNQHHRHDSSQPEIEIIEKHGIVAGLKISCVCGEIINIDFEYDRASGSLYLTKNFAKK